MNKRTEARAGVEKVSYELAKEVHTKSNALK